MWVEKYKPENLDGIIGNLSVIKSIRDYKWRKPLLIYGPTGTGKSALIKALCNELNFDLTEVNDDNIGNAKNIVQTSSLFGNRKLILIDNVDKVSDIRAVGELLKETKNPMVLITSDFKSKRLSTIKRSCEKLQIRKPSAGSISKLLLRICESECITADSDVLRRIAENSGGDVRAAINDLETLAKGRKSITGNDLDIIEMRDKKTDIYKALNSILIKKDPEGSIKSTFNLDEQPRDILLWIDENIPQVFRSGKALKNAYNYLSRADVFLGRIVRRQYWGFLRYANPLMTAGVNVSKEDNMGFAMYKFPFYIIKMGQTKKERNLKKSIGLKLSLDFHCSSKTIAGEYIPLLRMLIKRDRISTKELVDRFELNEEEVGYLT